MDRARILTFGVAAVVFSLVLLSAWTYLQNNVDEHAAMAGPVSPGDSLPEEHPEVAETVPAAGGATAEAGEQSPAPDSSVEGSADLGTPTSLDPAAHTAFDATGSVTVDAALLTPGAVSVDPSLDELVSQLEGGEIGILLSFNAHAGDLSSWDAMLSTSLTTPSGEAKPVRWVTESEGSHHRSGVVVFPSEKVDLAASGQVTLAIADLGDVPERVLAWTLPVE